MMKITIENLGPIKKSTVELGDFTIITGKNNTGKTYFSYALYGFLNNWFTSLKKIENLDPIIQNLIQNGTLEIDLNLYKKEVLENLRLNSEWYSQNIYRIFSANKEEFAKTKFSLNVDEEKYDKNHSLKLKVETQEGFSLIGDKKGHILVLSFHLSVQSQYSLTVILQDLVNEIINRAVLIDFLPKPHVITSERTGINIFQKELDINKNVLFEQLIHFSKSDTFEFNPFTFLKDVFDRYSKPIRDSIERVRNKDEIIKKNSFIYEEHREIISHFTKSLAGINFKIIKDNNRKEYFTSYREGRKRRVLPLYLSSSSTRSLLDFYVYLRHIASKNDILIIDEPELNLHPDFQIKFIRLLSSLVNLGIKILITTHSDYIVKEVNNLIMINYLTKKERAHFMKKYKYKELEYIDPKYFRFYIAEKNTFSLIEMDTFGLKRTNFDKTIEEINDVAEDLFERISKIDHDN